MQLSMECNREELPITFGGGSLEGALLSPRKRSSPEAWAAQLLRSGSPGPIAEAFSHLASQRDSGRALAEIFWSLQSSNRPTSRWVSLGMSRLSRALAGSRKCAREWGLFDPAPAGLIFLKTSTGALSRPAWKRGTSWMSRTALAPNLRKHPAPPLRVASGPGESSFGLA
jgi:hypothetical protein